MGYNNHLKKTKSEVNMSSYSGHIWRIDGLDTLSSVSDCFSNLHQYLKFMPQGAEIRLLGSNGSYEDDGSVYIFVRVRELNCINYYWELVMLNNTGNEKVKTFREEDLPIPANEINHVFVSVVTRQITVAFYTEGDTATAASRIRIDVSAK